MTGTGLKKWRPPNLSPRCVALAISVMEREEVLLANRVELGGGEWIMIGSKVIAEFTLFLQTLYNADIMAMNDAIMTMYSCHMQVT